MNKSTIKIDSDGNINHQPSNIEVEPHDKSIHKLFKNRQSFFTRVMELLANLFIKNTDEYNAAPESKLKL